MHNEKVGVFLQALFTRIPFMIPLIRLKGEIGATASDQGSHEYIGRVVDAQVQPRVPDRARPQIHGSDHVPLGIT